MDLTETPDEREARLLAEAELEVAASTKNSFQEALGKKPDSDRAAAPGLLGRALYRLGIQSKFWGSDGVTNEKSSN